jgi:hypothetical protein
MGFQTIAPGRRRLDGRDAIFQHDVMRRLLESQAGYPPTVHQRPRRSMVVMAMAQQERRQLLTGLTETADRRQAGAHEIADRFMSRIRNPDRGQFAGSMQLGQVDRIPTVGLDPISWLARDWSNDDALMPGERQLTLNSIAARSGLITEQKLPPASRKLRRQRFQRRRRVRDPAVLPNVFAPFCLGKRDCDRVLVNVEADICDRLIQDPSPMHEARRRPIRCNPRYLHTARRVAPYSGGHVV